MCIIHCLLDLLSTKCFPFSVSDNAPRAAELDELKKYIIGIRPAHKNDLDVVIRLLRDNEAEPKLKFDIEHQRSLRPTAPVENVSKRKSGSFHDLSPDVLIIMKYQSQLSIV